MSEQDLLPWKLATIVDWKLFHKYDKELYLQLKVILLNNTIEIILEEEFK